MHLGLPIALVLAICMAPPLEDKSWLKRRTNWVKSVMHRDSSPNGFYAAFSGFPPGSGIAAGPGYRRALFGARAVVDGSALASWSRGTVVQARFELPRLMRDQLTVGAQIKRQDFRRVNFFGLGSESLKANHSDYSLENTDVAGFADVRATSRLTVGGQVGYSRPVTIGRPRATSHPATEDLFPSDAAPGLLAQPAFVHGDVFAEVDTRNHPSRATTGGAYRVTVSAFSDRDYNRFNFRRYEWEGLHFIPTFSERGVIALRARAAASDTSGGNVVPFYLQPSLGGSRSLRGYSDYRFTDRNALLLNAEYRWRVHRVVDAAFFYDAGQVARRFGDLDFSSLKTSYGVGVRIISRTSTVLRLDVARSPEGTRLFLSFGEVFRTGHRSILIPYVP